jgi:hypothetical protein
MELPKFVYAANEVRRMHRDNANLESISNRGLGRAEELSI